MADGDLFLDITFEPDRSPIAVRAYELAGPLHRRRGGDELLFDLLEVLTEGDRPVWELAENPGMVEFLRPQTAPAKWLPWMARNVGARLTAGMSEQQQRLEVEHPSGYERGREDTIRAMVDGYLTGGRAVIFRPRFDGNAYWLVIRTRLAETPDPVALEAALASNIPAGLRWDYQAVDERDWVEVEETWETWADVEAANANWDDVNVP